jgi:hypothetical protein
VIAFWPDGHETENVAFGVEVEVPAASEKVPAWTLTRLAAADAGPGSLEPATAAAAAI